MIWPQKISEASAILLSLISLVCFIAGANLVLAKELYLFEWGVVTLNSMNIKGVLLLDWMSLMFVGVVMIISASILYYSGSYMKEDLNYVRFFHLVLLFVGSMVLMILSPNLISILLGWDGLGLISYCLVIFYQNNKSFNAGMITILSNRIGDVGLLISIGWMMSLGEWNIYLMPMGESSLQAWVGICILLAGITKSAQLPFSAWLPAAMAAPTPVSALVHSSTLVTAGVYLLIRFYEVLSNINWLMDILFYLAIMTSLMAGLSANFECDMKKIVALSTLSQLGLMMGAVSLGAVLFAYCHLLTHALFKALLFMCAGSFIHVMGGYQDVRFMGGLINVVPVTAVCFNISNLSLCGAPFLAGFYSKDLILEWGMSMNYNIIMLFMLFCATGLTCSYSFKLSWYTMGVNYYFFNMSSGEDEDKKYSSPMLLLLLGAIFSGAMLSWVLFCYPGESIIGFWWKISPISLFMGGLMLSIILSLAFAGELFEFMLDKSLFISSMWFTPYISTQMIIISWLNKGMEVLQLGDFGWSELGGGEGINYYFLQWGEVLQKLQNNSIKLFIFLSVVWGILFISLSF